MEPEESQNPDQQLNINSEPILSTQEGQPDVISPQPINTSPLDSAISTYSTPLNPIMPDQQPDLGNSDLPPQPITETNDIQENPPVNQYFAPNPVIPTEASQVIDNISDPNNSRITDNTVTSPVDVPIKKKSKKMMIISIIIALLLVVLGGGAVLGYKVWYSNPEKVITDALINAITAKTSIYKGTVLLDNNTYKVKIDITAKQVDIAGSFEANLTITTDNKEYIFNGSALMDKTGDVYFKLGNLDNVIAEISGIADSFGADSVAINKLVDKINNQWIKISNDDLAQTSNSYYQTKICLNDAFKQFKNDSSAIAEITDLYKKNPLFVIDKELGSKDGSVGYSIKGDSSVTTAFKDGLKNTKIYASIKNCDGDPLNLEDENNFGIVNSMTLDTSGSEVESNVELWINSWSHQITKIVANGVDDNGSTMVVELIPQFNQDFAIETPADSLTFADIMPYTTEIFSSSSSLSSQSINDIDPGCPSAEELGEGVECEVVDGEVNYSFSNIEY